MTIVRKQEWPDWRPPPEMIQRQPYLPRFMAGVRNPMGARAMYLGGTVYRIHGTNQPDTIGTNVSSGMLPPGATRTSSISTTACRSGTKVIVRQAAAI